MPRDISKSPQNSRAPYTSQGGLRNDAALAAVTNAFDREQRARAAATPTVKAPSNSIPFALNGTTTADFQAATRGDQAHAGLARSFDADQAMRARTAAASTGRAPTGPIPYSPSVPVLTPADFMKNSSGGVLIETPAGRRRSR